MNVLVVVLLVLSFKTVALENGDLCTTPNNSKCVPSSVCELISKASSFYGYGTEKNVQRAPCGYSTEPLVCCDIAKLENMYSSLSASTHPTPEMPQIISDYSDKSVCGLEANTIYKTTEGHIAQLEEFPWIAALEYESVFTNETEIRCGGSLINSRYVLTAAHCLEHAEFQLIQVWLGVPNITSDENCLNNNGNMQNANLIHNLKIEKTIPHEFYNRNNGYNDIGLIRLEKEIKFTDYIRPICLPSSDSAVPKVGLQLTVAGWGITSNGYTTCDVKVKMELSVRPNSICGELLKYEDKMITSDHLCVGGNAGKNSCLGEPGGPLMGTFGDVQQWYLEGIASYEVDCVQNAHPGIYTRVARYVDWIINIIDEQQKINKTDEQRMNKTDTRNTIKIDAKEKDKEREPKSFWQKAWGFIKSLF